ncbi:MAG: tetratricopeptide repeat protein [Planctomycetota bacterium]|jgi:CHAT domain-containing protein/Tfp pilus assembly protein PilF
MRLWNGRWSPAVLVLGIAAAAVAQSPGDPRLTERDRLSKQVLVHARAGRVEEAIADLEKVLAIEIDAYGDVHARIAGTLTRLAKLQERNRDLEAARRTFQQALAVQTKLHGADHWKTADARDAVKRFEHRARLTPQQRKALRRCASLAFRIRRLHDEGAVRKCLPMAKQAREISRRVLGEECSITAKHTGMLAHLHQDNGLYAQAERLYIRTVEILRSIFGEEHPATAWNISALGRLYLVMGDYAKAEPLCVKGLAIRKKLFGTEHIDTARSFTGLGKLYRAMGDRAQAESFLHQALEVRRRILRKDKGPIAQNLADLGAICSQAGEYARAEPLLLQALEIWKKRFTEEHQTPAVAMNQLGTLYRAMGRYHDAERYCRRALEIWTKMLGEGNPRTARAMSNLGRVYVALGEYDKAEKLLQRALAIRIRRFGRDHPETAESFEDLASLHDSRGEHVQAARLLERALDTRRRLLDSAATVQSERQQMNMAALYRGTLDTYLSLAPRAKTKPGKIYAPVMAWQGTVFLRQARMREVARHPKLAALFDRYSNTTSQLAARSLAAPGHDYRESWLLEIEELTKEKEAIEKELYEKSEAFRKIRDAQRPDPARLREALPDGVALVDFLVHAKIGAPRFVAFVVRRDKEIAMVDLGPVAPAEKAIDAWRASRGQREGGTLRRLLWDPLLPHLQGAGTVLLSPDGALGRLSFAGLPGKKPGTYLIEEVALGVVPVARMLPSLLREPGAEGEVSLLLLGDVDYGDPAEDDAPVYKRLAGTRAEILAIRDSFEQKHDEGAVTVLRRAKATESAFREKARAHRWLHLATHGFFAPAKLQSALAPRAEEQLRGLGSEGVVGHHPGLLSGLAFAGANAKSTGNQDDGILTAVEVAALDLSKVEVVILSACETGLGRVAAGEGILGLQRAFQVSGARTTVTSLWKVPDAETNRLMQRFYENLWERDMGKLPALREAQLWMLAERRARGLAVPRDGNASGSKRLPAHYWAAFVLAGDWR